MKKSNITVILMLLVAPLCFMACSENDDTEDEFADWQNRNEVYFSDIFQRAISSADDNLDTIRNYTFESASAATPSRYIVVEKLTEGEGSGSPLYTDSVLVNYRGRLIPSASYTDGYVFDQSYYGEYDAQTAKPARMLVSGVIDGFSTALQNMRIGDRWRVYIPYQLGYGVSGSGTIPGYSTLIFDIALVAYYRAGTTIGPWYSPQRVWITE